MPGPWSRTVTSPPRTATSTSPPGGLHLAALSSRLPSARSSVAGNAVDERLLEIGLELDPGPVALRPLDRVRRRRGRGARPRARPACCVAARELDQLGDQRRHLAELLDRRPRAAARARRRAAPGRARAPRCSCAGSSAACAARATRRRRAGCCARVDSSSAPSIVLKLLARRLSSSRPSTSIRSERSPVSGHRLGRLGQPPDGRERGARDDQAERRPRSAMPPVAIRIRSQRIRARARSVSSSGRAICTAKPGWYGNVITRTWLPATRAFAVVGVALAPRDAQVVLRAPAASASRHAACST